MVHIRMWLEMMRDMVLVSPILQAQMREIQTELSVSVLCHIISGVILTKGV